VGEGGRGGEREAAWKRKKNKLGRGRQGLRGKETGGGGGVIWKISTSGAKKVEHATRTSPACTKQCLGRNGKKVLHVLRPGKAQRGALLEGGYCKKRTEEGVPEKRNDIEGEMKRKK